MRFLDTNVLLYAISRDPEEQIKAKRAQDLLRDRDLALACALVGQHRRPDLWRPGFPGLARRGFVAADNLQPWKARILLSLALAKTDNADEIQRMFDTY